MPVTIIHVPAALRQLYEIPSHAGRQIDRWVFISPEKIPTSSQSMVIPQLSLHISGGTILDIHPYGRQAIAQVYGSLTATQEVLDSAAGGAQSFPWVRFYARRFGTTTVPLTLDSPTIAGSSVSITPAEFDELDEIIDGWKTVTLRFATPPTMGTGTNPQWRWSATSELQGNRWEVLGAFAPAISGIPGNMRNLVPAPNQLSLATYGAPVSGANINLGWVPGFAPMVSATTDDQTADAVLIFAKDMPLITGFTATNANQEVVGIGLDCGLNPCCVPTEIAYNRITWGLPANTGAGYDSFTRTVAGGWGTADIGGAYTVSAPTTDWSVDGSKGILTFSNVNWLMYAILNTGSVNFDVASEITFNQLVATNLIRAGVAGRMDSTFSNGYQAQIRMASTGAVSLSIDKFVAGAPTTISTISTPGISIGPGGTLSIRFLALGTLLKAKIWNTNDPEPVAWNLEVSDTSITTGTWAGIVGVDESAVTGHSLEFDNLTITPPQFYFGTYELQRMDTVEPDWQTIMLATSPALTGFNDYEARVGILSSYRIRAVDMYDFPGPWSSTVTATIPEPGVTIGCDDGHLLIFTSNDQQDGSINLAYSSVWEEGRTVEESFVFPEAQFVQLQAMYNRDFFTAFRPTERGGEQFARTVLVQAAAIAPETLADFTSLRDMAWTNVPYICVRDEDGNRWFATILVPGGRVLRDRRLYLAPIEVIEVTATPSETDPPWPTST